MRAAILAGGRGSRISTLFPDLPKPMIPLGGKPLLQYQLETLSLQGISDVTLLVGYKAEAIREYFGDGEAFGVKLDYITEREPLGTGGALPLLPKDDTLLLMGDVYIDMDFERLFRFHSSSGADITLSVHPNSHPHDSDIVVADVDGRVTGWSHKNEPRDRSLRNLVNAGVYFFRKNALPRGEVKKLDLEKDVIVSHIKSGKVFAYHLTEYIKDMGTPERFLAVSEDIAHGIPAARNLKNKQKAVFLDRDGTINILRGLISSPEQLELLPQAAEAIRMLNKSCFLAICVTNQPVVARGLVTPVQLDEIHAKLDALLGIEGAYLDDLLFCPHHPDKGYPEEALEYKIDCECRKPKPGMLIDAAKMYNIDLAHSVMVGDSTTDIVAGKVAGCKTIGLRTGEGLKDLKHHVTCDCFCDNLYEAVREILKESD